MQSILKLGYVHNRMLKGFIIQNVIVEIIAPVSVTISFILLKVSHRFVEHLM